MKIVKSFLLSIFIVVILTSSSLRLVTTFTNGAISVYEQLEDFVYEISEITEVQYEEYYVTTPQFNTAYNNLNSKQKRIYSTLYTVSNEMPEGYIKLIEKYDNVNSDITVAYNALLYDHNEIFWMPNSYMITDYQKDNITYTAIAFSYNGENKSVDYNVTKEKRNNMQGALNLRIKKILGLTENLKSDYEVEKFFNDYICKNTEYKKEGWLLNTAYGALINGQAHCEGYSRAFKLLCNKAGLECDLVIGTSFDEGHMWNVVNLDGIHNYVDVTWNDRADYKSYQYFNITKKQMEFDHKFSSLFSEQTPEQIIKNSFNFVIRESTYTGNTFYEKSGQVLPLNYVEKAAEKIDEAFQNGETYVEFLITSENTMNSFKNNNNSFIKGIQDYLVGIKIDSYIFERDVLVLFFEKA